MTEPNGLPEQNTESLIKAFAKTSTSIISDVLDRLPGALGIRPFHRFAGTVAGTALTVRVAAGDNLALHQALATVEPGQFVVVDGDGDETRAVMGEIMVEIAIHRGAAGVVIDGAIRDATAIGQGTFPVFARTAIHRGPYKNGPGHIGGAVSVGGLIVNTGDIVVADEDGVVAFPRAGAEAVLENCLQQERMEAEMIASIRAGTYTGAYGAPAK